MEVPLGEGSEAYEVDIIKSEVVVRTINVASESAAYSAVEQAEDSITPGEDITVIIYQISETVDRGYGREETI
jgi:hypothetical protein